MVYCETLLQHVSRKLNKTTNCQTWYTDTIPYHTIYHTIPYAISYHTIYHTIPYTIPYHTIYHTVPHHTIYHTIPYTIPYRTIPHTIPHHTIPYHTIPYHTIPSIRNSSTVKFFKTSSVSRLCVCLQAKKYLTWWTPEIELRGTPDYVFFHEDGSTAGFRNDFFLISDDGQLQRKKIVSVNHAQPSKPCCVDPIQKWCATHIETKMPPSAAVPLKYDAWPHRRNWTL
jgi:hypothetical protein